MKKRLTSLVMAVLLCLQLLPVGAFAAVDPDTNLCEHHTGHDTAVCGWVEGVTGVDCGHTHDETACYTQQTACTHTHVDTCYPTTESGEPGAEPTACTHTCSVESGCVTSALACPHTTHDSTCGYVAAVTAVPCGYVCQDCAAALTTCICDTKCTDATNADCPVCSGDGAVLAAVCNGQAADTTKYRVFVTDAPLDGSGGTVTGEGEYAPGEQVTISIVPNKAGGYCAAQWASTDLGMSPIAAFNQKTSHTFTMPDQNVEISITFVNHELKFYRSLENKTHVAYCLQCNEESDTPENCIDEVGGADELGPPDERCDKCGYDWHVHSFVDAYGSNDTHHWRSCSACGDEQVDYTPHTYGTEWSFDETNHYHACVCGKQTDVAPHSMATDWTSNEEGHGHFCSCGATFDFEEHNPGPAATETTAQTCIDCGYEIAPALGHTHSYSSSWSSDASGHWHKCSCGATSDFAGHTSSGAASYGVPETCTVCGYEIAPAKTTYSLTVNYEIYASSGAIIGSGIESRTVEFAPGTVVDLSEYWPEQMTSIGNDGTTYYFRGFSYATDGGGNNYNAVTVSENTVIYATWVRQDMVTVEFDTNGGEMSYKKALARPTYRISNMNSLHIPVRAGYEFAGWSLADDGTADNGEVEIEKGRTLYAVWQQYRPSYDDDYYDPPPASIPINVGGDYDAILRDGVVIVRGDDPISGTLDLGKTAAEAIRLPGDAVKASTADGNAVTIRFPGGTAAALTGSGLVAAGDALRTGESLQISVTQVDAGALPENLTAPPKDEEPFEDDEVLFDSGTLTGSVIFTEQELLDLNVIDENNDEITWNELKYLYHYMTLTELRSLGWFIEDFLANYIDPQVQVWLAEMIEREAVRPLNMQELMNMADLTDEQWELLADAELNDPRIGDLRQAGLTLEQMQLLQSNAEELREGASAEEQAQYDALLSWLEEAIAQKELEQENAIKPHLTRTELMNCADLTDDQMRKLSDMGVSSGDHPTVGQIKKLDLTLEQMELLYAEIDRARSEEHYSGYQEEYDVLLNWLEEAISEKEQEEQEAGTTYINVGGERAVFVGAVEADVKAVRASGAARNLEILADRSNAVAWSTNIQWSGDTQTLVDGLRAYKVLEDGTLAAKAVKVTVNADGTLTASALSNGNSTYIFVLEPNPYTDVDENDWYYDAAMTMDQRLVTLGASSTSFGGGEPVSNETVWTALARLDGVIIETYAALEWVVVNGISDGANGDKNITREQLALMLWQYAKSIGMDVSVGESTNILSYTDFTQVSEDAIPAMQWAMGAGILPDMGEELQPQREATRAEVAVALTVLVGGESPQPMPGNG